jgi:hypothetical protein
MKLLGLIKSKIRKIILCGIPLNDLREEDIASYKILEDIAHPEDIICFQNSGDLHGNYREVLEFLDKINSKVKIISKNSLTHEYPYTGDFVKYLKA